MSFSHNNINNVPFHPQLPSPEIAYKDYTLVYSDHTPILATVPNPRNPKMPFKVVSWNVLQADSCSGFSNNENRTVYGETEEQTQQRHDRIADAIIKFIKEHKPDFITLQELGCFEGTSNDERQALEKNGAKPDVHDSIYQRILKRLEHENIRHYGTFNHAPSGMLTFYNKDMFTLVDQAQNQRSINMGERSNSALFALCSDPTLNVKFASAHHFYDLDTRKHENTILRYLTGQDSTQNLHRKNADTLSIIAGDFNGSIASLNKTPHNTTTSVAAAGFRINYAFNDPLTTQQMRNQQSCQAAYALDTCFSNFQPSGESAQLTTCRQSETTVLDVYTGNILTAEQLLPIDLSVLNEFQLDIITNYRQCITIDATHPAYPETDETIFELQDRLINESNDNDLNAKLFANLNNQQTVGIEVPVSVYRFMRNHMETEGMFAKRIRDDLEVTTVSDRLADSDRVYMYNPTHPEKLIYQIRIAYYALRKDQTDDEKNISDQLVKLINNTEVANNPIGQQVLNAAILAANDPALDKQCLLSNLEAIYKAADVKDPESIKQLISASNNAQGAPNRKLQVLGFAMMALGALLCTLGALVLATSIVPLPHAIPAVAAGSVSIGAGVGLLSGGATLFYCNRLKSDSLSAGMKSLARSLQNQR